MKPTHEQISKAALDHLLFHNSGVRVWTGRDYGWSHTIPYGNGAVQYFNFYAAKKEYELCRIWIPKLLAVLTPLDFFKFLTLAK